MNLSADEAMREMAKIAMENATEFLAKFADDFAGNLDPSITGPEALRAFAEAIRSTNKQCYPTAELNG